MRHLNKNWLIADIGATMSRCATYNLNKMRQLQIVENDDYSGLVELLDQYIKQSGINLDACALSVAAPIDGEEIRMINRNWSFSRRTIAELGFQRVEIINDFHSISHALPYFTEPSRIEIGNANAYRHGNIAVLGPGTGLGMSAWIDGKATMCGEGGHITLSGRDKSEDEIIAALRNRFGHCSAERVLSGPGLLALHEAMHNERLSSPEEISKNTNSQINMETMHQWFLFLGTVAAELALITGAVGGVYIAGGIVPKCIEQINNSDFRSRFEDKNRYRNYMQGIPTWVVTDPVPGLTGLTCFIDQLSSSQKVN